MRLYYAVRAEERLLDDLKDFGYTNEWIERVIKHPIKDGLTPNEYTRLVKVREQARERRKLTGGGATPPLRRLDGKPRKNVFLENDAEAAAAPPEPKPPSRSGRYIRST